jgi:hypothetical protein
VGGGRQKVRKHSLLLLTILEAGGRSLGATRRGHSGTGAGTRAGGIEHGAN